MSEVVHSVNIMIAILLVAVGITIYWIFKYDDWNPNPITDSHISSEHGSNDSGHKELPVGTEKNTH